MNVKGTWAILPKTPNEPTRNMDNANPLVTWLSKVSLFPSRSMLTAMPGAIKIRPARPTLSHGRLSSQVVQGRAHTKSQGTIRLKNIFWLNLRDILNKIPI
jgi:hypothetical protein